MGPDPTAVAIGQEARVLTSPGSASPTTGWSSDTTCPDATRQGILSSVPAGSTLANLDAASTTGVVAEPTVTEGDVPSCAYAMTVSGQTVDAVIFIGMGKSYQTPIIAKLVADGFAPGATSTLSLGTVQLYTRGITRVVVENLQEGDLSVFAVIG